jgi:hypothetical protein
MWKIELIFLENAKLKILFYCHGQARSPMTNFFIDCFFNGFCKGRKNLVLTPPYAKNLRTMWHGAKSRLRAMPDSAELLLRAMPHSAEF